MKFFLTATAAATIFATLASAYNGFAGPAEGEKIPAGKPYLIKWEADTDGPVHITLRKGARTDLDTLYEIVMLEYNWGNYTWNVPADTAPGQDYAFEMKWGKDPRPEDVNYTGLFEITNGEDVEQEEPKSTTTESSTPSATESESKTATETETESASEKTSAPTSTGNDTSATETSTPTGKKSSTTKTASGPTSTPPVKDADSSAGVLGASAGMAAAVAFAAVAFL